MADVFLLRCPTGCKSVDVENSCLHQVVVWKSNNIPTIFRCFFFSVAILRTKNARSFWFFQPTKKIKKSKKRHFSNHRHFKKTASR